MEDHRVHNPHGPLEDEVIRLLHTPRPRVKGFFADLPPAQRHMYVIPPPPPDENDGSEDRVWGSVESETTTAHGGQRTEPQETGESRQIRGRRHNIDSQTPGAAGSGIPRGERVPRQ
ncbi:hypothetical protein HPB52_000570 [Rhipicephalus sanguineus]|uniref:Uncharacterized protein n=1 Tax=Rhipicephalus sanguineus TaxID=34632 RepID=A0A9D4T6P4_RHISA|nr:hypothetical protein HPB52_000570 [Rhipicephalus sanguineus]